MNNLVFERARKFMYRNARPLDMTRFQYHFEAGSKEAVMQALSYYQNEDGGFGDAVEAECRNPNSIPLHSNVAESIISEIDYEDAGHPVIQRLLRWYTERESSTHTDYNGLAQGAGFLIRYGQVGSEPYQLGVRIANEAVETFVSSEITDMHTCACYVHMLESIIKAGAEGQVPCKLLMERLHTSVNGLITTDKSKWDGDICKPSRFLNSRDSMFYPANKEIAEYECEYITDTQLSDGSWNIPRGWKNLPDEWTTSRNWWERECEYIADTKLSGESCDITRGWEAFPDEWAISKNWWKGQVIIENLLYLKGFGKI